MLSATLGALIPVFGLILLGVGCGRVDLLGPRAFEVLMAAMPSGSTSFVLAGRAGQGRWSSAPGR